MPSPFLPRVVLLYVDALQAQLAPHPQVVLQAQVLAQVQVSACVQPHDFFSHRHSFWVVIGVLLVYGGPSCPPFTQADAGAPAALHRLRSRSSLAALALPCVPARMEELRITRCGSFELRTGCWVRHSYGRHAHDELFLTAITGGAARFRFGGASQIATPGTLVSIAPGDVHAHEAHRGGRSFSSLHGPAIAGVRSERAADPASFAAFMALHRNLDAGATRLESDTLFTSFWTGFVREPVPAARREPVAVRRSLEFLHAHAEREVSLRELAEVANLSPFHFHRVFERHVGLPPHAYQIQLRLLRARALLRCGTRAAAVAALTGFADQSHFTRHFRRLMGMTPRHYSKNVLDPRRSRP